MIPTILPTYNRAPLSFTHGQGSWLFDADGERYLDLAAGIAVNALGHADPRLVAALTEQAGRLWHVSNLYRIPQQQELADLLCQASFADSVFFTNSGTEAAELAIKMARRYWFEKGDPRPGIITFEGAFHGRSTGAIAAAGSEKMTLGFGPLMPGFRQVPFGDLDALRAAIGPDTGAVMIEPIQGEGGIRTLADADLAAIRAICDESGLLLILDEVQCGMGRTGRLFAHEWAGIVPDIVMVAKGIGGGFPLGAVLARENAAAAMTAGSHGSTYGGNPLACAVGLAVSRIVSEPEFLQEVGRKGAALRAELQAVVDANPDLFEEVRGRGLMLGLKCRVAPVELVQAGYKARILTVPAADNVVRVLPPLNITDDEISEAGRRLRQAVEVLRAGTAGN